MVDPRTRGRLMLVLLAVVFLGPLAASFVLYYGDIWKPAGSTEHGSLIAPPPLVPETLPTSRGELPMRGLWSLVIVTDGDCDATCAETLYETRQLRRALGRELDRVQRVWLVDPSAAGPELLAAHPDVAVADLRIPEVAAAAGLVGPREAGEVFVVDPIGNLMMRFPPGTGMRGIHTDLKRLLRVSRIG